MMMMIPFSLLSLGPFSPSPSSGRNFQMKTQVPPLHPSCEGVSVNFKVKVSVGDECISDNDSVTGQKG